MLVSIIIPTHNRHALVMRAIDSILNQSYKNFELLIVDDGSTDKTEDAIRLYSDKRIKYIQTKKMGVVLI